MIREILVIVFSVLLVIIVLAILYKLGIFKKK